MTFFTTALKAESYIEPEVYQRECAELFKGCWLLLCHQSELENDGDAIVRTIAGIPFMIAKTEDTLRGFLNICPHRAGPLLWEGNHHELNGFRCRYHGWRYDWEGQLTRAPDFGAACPDLQLSKVSVALRSGLIFCNTNPEASEAELDAQLSPLFAELSARGIEHFGQHHYEAHELKCGWKTYAENYLEGYHIPYLHPGLMKGIRMGSYKVAVKERVVTHLVDTKKSAVSDGYWAFAWPNLAVNVYESGLSLERIIPLAFNRTRIEYIYLFPESTSEETRQSVISTSDTITREDILICEAVQQNLETRTYVAGPLSPKHENGLQAFHQWWRATLGETQ